MSRASVPFSEAVDQRRCYRGDVSLLESSRSASFQYSPASWTWSCRRRRRRIICWQKIASAGGRGAARRAGGRPSSDLPRRLFVGETSSAKAATRCRPSFLAACAAGRGLDLVTHDPARRSATGASA